MAPILKTRDQIYAEIDSLVEQYRDMCLWFSPRDYYPSTDETRLKVLHDIERHGDREAFMRSRELRHWLLQPSRKS